MNGRGKRKNVEIEADEIFADSSNIPEFDTDRFEGRVERPLPQKTFLFVGIFVILLLGAYLARAWDLQIKNGALYAARAEANQLSRAIIFADRGIIYDRTGRVLASNVRADDSDFSQRVYAAFRGLAEVVGYAKPPAHDTSGTYFEEHSNGIIGAEAAFDTELQGSNGARLTETNAVGKIVSESTVMPPQDGQDLHLSIDAAVSQGLYDSIAGRAQASKFIGGAGVMMDVHTGQIIAMVSYPEYSLQTMADGTNTPAIAALLTSKQLPFLNRSINAVYAPGSIVKPFVGVGALAEGVIGEYTQILSTGSISVPNPYDPAHPSIFKDWRAQGWVDMRNAIRVSSDVYFYEVGGGFGSQKGLGIDNINKYLRMFGFGQTTGLAGFTESAGNIPSPAWKAAVFPGDPWRIGDTYHTAIGQYGTTVTPLQAARATAALANNGFLLTPTLLASSTPQGTQLSVPQHDLEVIREGMRMDVNEQGTAAAINVPFVNAAGKTGTAQTGTQNQYMNSWLIAFFPYEHPHYVIAIVLEKAPAGTLVGSPAAGYDFLTWLHQNAPQYLQ